MKRGEGEAKRASMNEKSVLTPAQAQEALADDAVAQTTSDSHVGLPSFCQHPAERGEEKEVQEGSDKSAHHLWKEEKSVSEAPLHPGPQSDDFKKG